MGAGATTGKNGLQNSKLLSFNGWNGKLTLYYEDKKFNQCYMLARELGSGAFSIVKLGVHLVSLNVVILNECFN
jgi:hypothetical protein